MNFSRCNFLNECHTRLDVWETFCSILFPPSIHISCVCLFTWPETWLFIIGSDHHMLRGSIAIWHHQVAELVAVLRCRIHDVSTILATGTNYLGYIPFTQRENWCYSLTSLDGAQVQQTFFQKFVSRVRIRKGVNCFAQKIMAFRWIKAGL